MSEMKEAIFAKQRGLIREDEEGEKNEWLWEGWLWEGKTEAKWKAYL